MSSIARWSYANTAMIKPFLGRDTWSGAATYGEQYEIACNWIAKSEQTRSDAGEEFISRHIVYHEDPRPKFLDQVLLNGATQWEEVRSLTEWDMAMFNDSSDFMMVT